MENTKCKKWAWFWGPVIFQAGLIFFLSSLSHPSIPGVQVPDKLAHVAIYSMLGALLGRAVAHSISLKTVGKNRIILLIVALACLLYGVSDEFHQSFVPGRSVEFFDVVADLTGGFLGGLFYFLLHYVRYFKKTH